MSEESPPLLSPNVRVRLPSGLVWKALALFVVGLLLLIPLAMVEGLLRERQARKAEAVEEIARQWGQAQTFVGPFLRVPFTKEETVEENEVIGGYANRRLRTKSVEDALWVVPERMDLKGELYPEVRYRGIFKAPVYNGALNVSAEWALGEIAEPRLRDAAVHWDRASVVFRVSDPGALAAARAIVEGEPRPARPLLLYESGEWAAVSLPLEAGAERLDAALSIELRGSEGFGFLPVGKSGAATIHGSWANPSFQGALLPARREVDAEGFEARWVYGEFGRSLARWWTGQESALDMGSIDERAARVDLLDPVDGYRMTERSLKYGALFIACGFAVFFLFETLQGLRLSVMHYLLAGAAQVVFFALVLSLSEVTNFYLAYAIAATAAVGLISLYASAALGAFRRAGVVAGVLGGVYAALLLILREQDYALLAGSWLLFAGLAVFMYLTRRLDWRGGTAGANA